MSILRSRISRLTLQRLALGLVSLVFFAAVGSFVTELWMEARYARRFYASVRDHPPHPFLQVLASAQVDHVNRMGFRGDPPLDPLPPGAVRIITMGGSTTLGVKNPYEQTYPRLLQRLLRQRYPERTFDVQNAGVSWYSTAHLLVDYELRVRRAEPDVVILFEAINDLYRSFSPEWWASGPFAADYSHYLGPYSRMLGPAVDRAWVTGGGSSSSFLIGSEFQELMFGEAIPFAQNRGNIAKLTAQLRAAPIHDFRSLESYRQNLARLADHILQDHRRLVIGTQASLYQPDLGASEAALIYFPQVFCAERGRYPDLESMATGMTAFNQAAREIAHSRGVTVADFDSRVPKTARYFSDDVHLTAAGNAILAQTALEALISAGIVDEEINPEGTSRTETQPATSPAS